MSSVRGWRRHIPVIAEIEREGMMAIIKRGMNTKYICCKGSKLHKAYLHSNVGANLIWCKKHGLLASYTLTRGKSSDRQMTKKEYKKFVEVRK